MINKNKNLF